jgi:hypothetical protein
LNGLKIFGTPIPYLVLGVGCYIFAPDVGPQAQPLVNDAAKLLMFAAALAYNPSAVLSRLGMGPQQPPQA